jgi:hypothetical protein
MDRFFIAGCQRTGTTLMRLLLECHPAVFCYDEELAYGVLARGEHVPPAGKRLVGFKVPRWTEVLGAEVLWDEGLAERAHEAYRGESIIFMLRDVRDTVASMIKLEPSPTKNWLETCARPILVSKLEGEAAGPFGRRFRRELALVRESGYALPLVGALYWKYKTQSYFVFRDRGWPVCPVRYELLVRQPRLHLQRVLRFLGVPWHEGVLHHPESPHTEIDQNGLAIGNTDPRRSIDAASVGQWRRFLTPEDESGVLAIAGDLNRRIRLEGKVSRVGHLARSMLRALAAGVGIRRRC